MLKRRPGNAVRATVAIFAAVTAGATTLVGPAIAQPGVSCPNGQAVVLDGEQVCFPRTTGPVTADSAPVAFGLPSGNGGGVQTECARPIGGTPGAGPETVRCYGPAGWYSYSWDCFFLAADEPPTEGMPGYEQHGDDGMVFRAMCWSVTTNPYGLQHWYPPADAWIGQELVVLAEPPDGYGGTP